MHRTPRQAHRIGRCVAERQAVCAKATRLRVRPLTTIPFQVRPRSKRLKILGQRSKSYVAESLEGCPEIKVGDLVEVKKQGFSDLGVVIQAPTNRISNEDNDAFYYTLVSNGHHILHRSHHVHFHIPRWAFSPLIQQPLPADTPTPGLTDRSRHLLATHHLSPDLPAHLHRFRTAAQRHLLLRDTHLNTVYNEFRQLRKEITLTARRAAAFAFHADPNAESAVSPAELYAAYVFLSKDKRYHPDESPDVARCRPVFRMKSEKEVSNVAWIAKDLNRGKNRPANTRFLEDAKLRIVWAKSLPLVDCLNPDGTLRTTPLNLNPPTIVFDEKAHHRYNRYLRETVFANREHGSPVQRYVEMGVLNVLVGGMGKPNQRYYDAVQLMRDLGVLHAWECLAPFPTPRDPLGVFPPLDGHGINDWADLVARYSRFWGKRILVSPPLGEPSTPSTPTKKKTVQEKPLDQIPFGADHEAKTHVVSQRLHEHGIFPVTRITDALPTTDTHAHLRRDFSTLPAFVIDSPTAKELDDGVSVEVRPDGSEWLHVHIADPTASFPANHPLAMLAQLRGTSVYLPERHHPLLPDALTRERLSLGAGGRPSLALTFSARVAEDGEIGEWEVTPSVLGNVRVVSYRDVSAVLEWKGVGASQGRRSVWLHRATQAILAEQAGRKPGLSDAEVAALRRLQAIARRHAALRVRRGGFTSDQPGFGVTLDPSPLPIAHMDGGQGPVDNAGSPIIAVDATQVAHAEPATVMVAELMVVAGRVAALFCRERGVPAVYRGQASALEVAKGDAGAVRGVERALGSVDRGTGLMPYPAFRAVLPYFAPATVAMTPLDHFSMGLRGGDGGYIKVTSPLRRYTDLVGHWLIKARMLDERMPFSPEDVFRIHRRVMDLERRAKRLAVATDRHWVLEWIRRREVLWRAGAVEEVVHGAAGPTTGVEHPPAWGLPLMPPTARGPRQAQVWSQAFARTACTAYTSRPPVEPWEVPVAERRCARPVYTVVVTSVRIEKGMARVTGMLAEVGGVACRVVMEERRARGVEVAVSLLRCVVETVDAVTGTLVMVPWDE
ncbi:hypothetical protein HDU96_008041 [Phlyctochytrium bullatum]|nr:hypothetical protein HDU96_008041 [Phlyctochytrium bullatum]